MNKISYKYPLLVLKNNDKNIYVFKSNFGLVSKGGDKFYKDLFIVDSECNSFNLIKVCSIKYAGASLSLRYFQKMYLVDLEIKHLGKIDLEDIKEMLIEKINKNKSHWLVIDTFEGMVERINMCNSISDICEIFR